ALRRPAREQIGRQGDLARRDGLRDLQAGLLLPRRLRSHGGDDDVTEAGTDGLGSKLRLPVGDVALLERSAGGLLDLRVGIVAEDDRPDTVGIHILERVKESLRPDRTARQRRRDLIERKLDSVEARAPGRGKDGAPGTEHGGQVRPQRGRGHVEWSSAARVYPTGRGFSVRSLFPAAARDRS